MAMKLPKVNEIVYMTKDVGSLRKGDTVIVREVVDHPAVLEVGYPVVVEPHGMLMGQEERAIPLNMPVTLDEITTDAPGE
jgi:hypothetical protein